MFHRFVTTNKLSGDTEARIPLLVPLANDSAFIYSV